MALIFRQKNIGKVPALLPSDINKYLRWNGGSLMPAAMWAMLAGDGTNDHRWRELCQLIMTEKDPQKLLTLVRELNQEFERREKQLQTPENPAGDK